MKTGFSTARIVVATLLAAAGLVFVGWFDYSATRRELLDLLRGQAAALRQTVAAAARSNEAAGTVASAQVTERLLDNARLLAELDRKGSLTSEFLAETAERNKLFRVVVFGPGGAREGGGVAGRADGTRARRRPAPGMGPGAGRGAAAGMGLGPGIAFVEPVLSGREREVVGELRPGGRRGSRVAAAVRRANGGAILVNADATEIESLFRQVSLDRLIESIAATTPQLAYVVVDRDGLRHAHGELPDGLPQPATGEAGIPAGVEEREREAAGHLVLELSSPLDLGQGQIGVLRLGLRMDEVRAAGRRMVTRMGVSLAAALLLSVVALGAIWLRQAYSTLSEKHARAEAALRRRDRLSAMGELASTVAHEVRNPLNAIAMSAQRLRREFTPAAASEADRVEAAELLAVMEAETGRIDHIVQQFLSFARPPRLAPAAADLGAEAAALVEAARPLAGRREVSIEADTAAAGEAVVDARQLRQAIDNLVRNAIEATPAGGRVRVTARSGGNGHTIEVRDTGSGIPPEDVPKIFDLYFTTKPDGTGVGLAVTQQIVAAHGGTIEVDSAPGAGTTMTIRLPADLDGATDA
jgi:signal transduction histidine kinase